MSLVVSIVFFAIYFAIYAVINTYTGLRTDGEERKFGDLLGPFTISLCSSLIIFSYATFVSQGMRHLSIVYPDVFFKSFQIFVISLIIIQIAGHAEISISLVTSRCRNGYHMQLDFFLFFYCQ